MLINDLKILIKSEEDIHIDVILDTKFCFVLFACQETTRTIIGVLTWIFFRTSRNINLGDVIVGVVNQKNYERVSA